MSDRVAVIGFDSPDLGLLERELAAGRMPVLEGLLRGGAYHPLEDTQAVCTPASWPTLARGVQVQDHGLLMPRMLQPGSYSFTACDGSAARTPPFWSRLAATGLRVTACSVYSSTIVPDVEGTQVVGWGSQDPYSVPTIGAAASEPGLIEDLTRRFGRRRIGWPIEAADPVELGRLGVEGIGQQGKALAHLARTTEWDLFFGCFSECHPLTHLLLQHADPTHPDHDPSVPDEIRDALPRVYRAVDRAIGELLEALAGAQVLVVSPYSHTPTGHLDWMVEPWLEASGWLSRGSSEAAGATARLRALGAGRRIVRAVVPPRLRPALGRLVPRDRWDGELALAGVDWSRSRAFRLPGDGSSFLRLNVAGREPEGSIAPADRERVRDELLVDLHGLRDADSGEPLVRRAVSWEDLFGAEPWGPLPDLCVEWRRGVRPRALRSASVDRLDAEWQDPRATVHRAPGFMLASGSGIAPSGSALLEGDPAKLTDVAATALDGLGLPSADLGRSVWQPSEAPR